MRLAKTVRAMEALGFLALSVAVFLVLFPMSDASRNQILQSISDDEVANNYTHVNIARIKESLKMDLDRHDKFYLAHLNLLGVEYENGRAETQSEPSRFVFWELNKPLVKLLFGVGAFLLVMARFAMMFG